MRIRISVDPHNAVIRILMQLDQWESLKEELKRKFKIESERTEDLLMETQDGPVKQGTADVVEFETPIGKIKLAFQSKPLVLDKREIYSHQQGKSARTEYTFSETEKTHKFKAYKWNTDSEEWDEIDPGNFSG